MIRMAKKKRSETGLYYLVVETGKEAYVLNQLVAVAEPGIKRSRNEYHGSVSLSILIQTKSRSPNSHNYYRI